MRKLFQSNWENKFVKPTPLFLVRLRSTQGLLFYWADQGQELQETSPILGCMLAHMKGLGALNKVIERAWVHSLFLLFYWGKFFWRNFYPKRYGKSKISKKFLADFNKKGLTWKLNILFSYFDRKKISQNLEFFKKSLFQLRQFFFIFFLSTYMVVF